MSHQKGFDYWVPRDKLTRAPLAVALLNASISFGPFGTYAPGFDAPPFPPWVAHAVLWSTVALAVGTAVWEIGRWARGAARPVRHDPEAGWVWLLLGLVSISLGSWSALTTIAGLERMAAWRSWPARTWLVFMVVWLFVGLVQERPSADAVPRRVR